MMSIYQSRLKRQINDDAHAAQTVPPGDKSTPAHQDWAEDWSPRRKVTPARNLLPVSVKWLLSLPTGDRPLVLAAKYPRIVNILALQWGKPSACRAYFGDLLVDRRGNRKGFPADVHRELRALRDYYHDLNPPGPQLALVE